MIKAVVFDVGETLVSEARPWGEWADWLGVTRFTFFAALGAVIAQDRRHWDVFQVVRPGLDREAEIEKRKAGGWTYRFEPGDFYPDAIPCLSACRAAGLIIGVAGNQPAEAEAALIQAGVQADFIASSARWGVEKPSQAFFDKVIEAAGVQASEIAYVGDRLDNDVLPAREAGMTAILVRRGPWGVIQAQRPAASWAHLQVETLDGLAVTLRAH